MPNLLAFNPAQYVGFIVIFARILGVFLSAPVLGDNNIPVQVKVGFTFVLSLVFFPLLAKPNLGENPDILQVIVITVSELAVGLLLGFSARLLYAGVGLAGEVVGFQMGVGIAHAFDPITGTQISLVGQIQMVFALLIFVVLDGHHILIQALATSYRLIPPGGLTLSDKLLRDVVALSGNIFLVGLRIGAPLIVALLAANFAIGLVARSVPQVNVFVVGLPFTIVLGLLLLALGFPFFIEAVVALQDRLAEVLMMVLRNG